MSSIKRSIRLQNGTTRRRAMRHTLLRLLSLCRHPHPHHLCRHYCRIAYVWTGAWYEHWPKLGFGRFVLGMEGKKEEEEGEVDIELGRGGLSGGQSKSAPVALGLAGLREGFLYRRLS